MAAVKGPPGQIRVVVNNGETELEEEAAQIATVINEKDIDDKDLEPLIALLDDMIANREKQFRELEEQYRQLGDSLKRLRRMRDVAVPNPERLEAPKPQRKKPSGRYRFSAETSEKIRAFIEKSTDEGEAMTITDICRETGVEKSTVASVVALLREEGKIRMSGRQRAKGATRGMLANAFVITDNGRS